MRCKVSEGLYTAGLGKAPGEFSTGLSTRLVEIRQPLVRFLIRSRLFTDDKYAALQSAGRV